MLKIQIIKNNQNLDSFCAETMQEIENWLEVRKAHKVFGAEAYSYQELVSEEVPEIKEIQLIEGVEVEVITQEYQPAVYQTIEVPAEYSYEITDITAELESSKLVKLRQIEELEALVTPRRYREALLSGDHSFIESIEAQIEVLRNS